MTNNRFRLKYLLIMMAVIMAVITMAFAFRSEGEGNGVSAQTRYSRNIAIERATLNDDGDSEGEDEGEDFEEHDEEFSEDEEFFAEDYGPFFIAEDLLNLDEETFWLAIENGETIAELATTNDVELQTIIDAIVQAEMDFVNELENEGEISAEDATEWRNEAEALAAEFVNESHQSPESIAANLLGIPLETVWVELEKGNSIADLAAANNVDPQTIIDAIVADELEFVEQLERDGEISGEEAAEWRAEVAEFATEVVNESYQSPESVAAEMLGMELEMLWQEMDNGRSIATLAAENNVDVQTIIDAIVAAETAFIDELEAEGDISATEANEWRAEAQEYIPELVNETFLDYEECEDEEELDFDEAEGLEDEDSTFGD